MLKHLLLIAVVVSGTNALAAMSQAKVIYGEDNREDVFRVSNSLYLKLASSTAAMIAAHKLKDYNSLQTHILSQTLEERGVCSTERFAKQPAAASCSGFLVGKNKILTAGHCVRSQFSCDNNSWVFDFKVDYSDQSEVVIDNENVYRCKKIISQVLDHETNLDYALIELDREVRDREVLKVSQEKAKVGDQLVVIGNPSGLPTKVADNASVRSVNDIFFVTDLDTYGGNSGSAVFNINTGKVLGILVRGATDYISNTHDNCKISNTLNQNEGRGEDVTLISQVPGIFLLPEQQDVVASRPDQDQGNVRAIEVMTKKRISLEYRILNYLRNLFS